MKKSCFSTELHNWQIRDKTDIGQRLVLTLTGPSFVAFTEEQTDALTCGQENRGISGRIWTRLDMYVHCKSFQKNGLRIACLTFETVVFTFYYLNPFFQLAGTQHYLGIGLYSVPITLFADGRVDFTFTLSSIFYMTWCRRSRFTGLYSLLTKKVSDYKKLQF